MGKQKDKNPIASYPGSTIDLTRFNLETRENQYKIIEDKLKEIYEDNMEVTRKHVMKVIVLTFNPKDDYIYLPYDLKVSKEKLELIFEVKRKTLGIGWIILGIWLLLFALIGATYSGIRYIKLSNLNKDIDGDGIADINIDINNDLQADINVDTDGDNKPNLNIDYKGNRKSIFNIDTDGDGKPDSNLVNDASTEESRKACKINCDLNGDGWPDINLDLDGDGKPDMDIDTDGDGVADLNIDLNGDSLCDVMCDTDGDGKCDINCIKTEYNGMGTGSSKYTGDPSENLDSAVLIIQYTDGETVNAYNLVPTDQPNIPDEVFPRPYKTFTIENLSNYTVEYNLVWKNVKNTFVSNNFKYKVAGSNGGFNVGYTVAPRTNDYIAKGILIPARTTQTYRFDFALMGTGQNQNEDQNKEFSALIDIET